MRHVIVKLDTKQSLEYKRPQSVEDAPVARDVDSFLRENNMEGLRGSGARDNDKRSEALGADLDESFNDEELN